MQPFAERFVARHSARRSGSNPTVPRERSEKTSKLGRTRTFGARS